jgi:hypothetical protein
MSCRWLGLLALALLLPSACRRQPADAPAPDDIAATSDPDLQGPNIFQDVTSASGIQFAYRNGEEVDPPHLSILESLGGGLAVLDFDGDGLVDLFLPGGGYFAGAGNKEIRGHPCKLYKNLGKLRFQDMTQAAGLHTLAQGKPWFYTHAAAVGDYDRDGWPDLLVTGWGRIALLHNVADAKGGRRFVDVSAEAGLDKGITWATSAAWGDLDADGWPDLYVCQYVNWSWENHPKHQYDGKTLDVAPPRVFQQLPHKLYRNNGKGAFIDVNLDGKPDIYVANDTVDNYLYVNQSSAGTIRLKEEGRLAGVALDGYGNANGSMGLDAGDPEGTGLPSLWVTNYENELHALYSNVCDKDRVLFLFNTPASGIAAIGQKYVGWGTGFIDLDHHGWEDLFVANGHAIRYPTGTTRRQKPVLLRNWKGKFKDITKRGGPYFHQEHLARGAVLSDLDNDGKFDLVVSHMNEPVAVLRGIAREAHHWLGVELVGAGHADVAGARIVVEADGRKQTRFAKGGGSYASAPDQRHLFGLAKADRVDKLTVIWPDGTQHSWSGLGVDCYHVLVQGEKEARTSRPRK